MYEDITVGRWGDIEHKRAVDLIKAESSKRYDTYLVDAFLQCSDDFAFLVGAFKSSSIEL